MACLQSLIVTATLILQAYKVDSASIRQSVCGNKRVTVNVGKSSLLLTPNFPLLYSRSVDCSWSYNAAPGEILSVYCAGSLPCTDRFTIAASLTSSRTYCGISFIAALSVGPTLNVTLKPSSFSTGGLALCFVMAKLLPSTSRPSYTPSSTTRPSLSTPDRVSLDPTSLARPSVTASSTSPALPRTTRLPATPSTANTPHQSLFPQPPTTPFANLPHTSTTSLQNSPQTTSTPPRLPPQTTHPLPTSIPCIPTSPSTTTRATLDPPSSTPSWTTLLQPTTPPKTEPPSATSQTASWTPSRTTPVTPINSSVITPVPAIPAASSQTTPQPPPSTTLQLTTSGNETNSPLGSPPSISEPPTNCTCGIQGPGLHRIVNGNDAGDGQFPWMVMLLQNSTEPFCGGSIIAPGWVITAAHCTKWINLSSTLLTTVAGRYSVLGNSVYEQFRDVGQVIQHPAYNSTTQDNDLALLKLQTDFVFNSAVSPICLPFSSLASFDFLNQLGVATGWGSTSAGGKPSGSLLQVTLPILTSNQCRQYPGIAHLITDNMMCTYEAGKDTCQGDSGGPLGWVDPVTRRTYLAGVTSWGIGCAGVYLPGVYAKVNNYLTWIKETTGEAFCKPCVDFFLS